MTNLRHGHELFLIPVGISNVDFSWYLPINVLKTVHTLTAFIAENAKTARYFLKFVGHPTPLPSIEILELDKHNPAAQKKEIAQFLLQHKMVGLMSEAGMPCIADPGNQIVRIAHQEGIKVKPLTGPSSILLALTASGLNGQDFRFIGYLPAKSEERQSAILKCEKDSKTGTQLFIEAPYRNDQLMKDLYRFLHVDTMLLVAYNLTGEDEKITCQPISWWKTQSIDLGKVPCIFGLGV
ncbi:MAG: SAM-dependent methyltransferase [Bacteroidota bacterium]